MNKIDFDYYYLQHLKMFFCSNFLLISLTSVIVGIGYILMPLEHQGLKHYLPQCLQMKEKKLSICVYCELNRSSNFMGQRETLMIENNLGLKVLGIKEDTNLKCSDYLHLVNFQQLKSQYNSDIQFFATKQIQKIIQETQTSQIVQVQKDSTITKSLIIDPQYKSFIIYQVSQTQKMSTKITLLQKDYLNDFLSIILSLIGLTLLTVIFLMRLKSQKQMDFDVMVSWIVLFMIILISKEDLKPNIDSYQYPALLLFLICLMKVDTNLIICVFMMIFMGFFYLIRNQNLIIGSYWLCLLLYIYNGYNKISQRKIFYYICLSIAIYICTHTYRINLKIYSTLQWQLSKYVKITILTLTTTIIQLTQTKAQQNIGIKSGKRQNDELKDIQNVQLSQERRQE